MIECIYRLKHFSSDESLKDTFDTAPVRLYTNSSAQFEIKTNNLGKWVKADKKANGNHNHIYSCRPDENDLIGNSCQFERQ